MSSVAHARLGGALSALLVGALLVGALSGCGDSMDTPCTTDEMCGANMICRSGSCFGLPPLDDCIDGDADGFSVGPTCTGQPDCNDEDPSINPGVTEACGGDNMGDNVDNNCMNGVDEGCACTGDGTTREECGMGRCAGTRRCMAGVWTECTPVVAAEQENCGPDGFGNTIDDDCDGDVDEGCRSCDGGEIVCRDMPPAFCSSNMMCESMME